MIFSAFKNVLTRISQTRFAALICCLLFLPNLVLANPLNFKAWKEQEILNAQNQLLRVSTRFQHEERSVHSGDPMERKGLKRDMKKAQDRLEFARELGLEEYVTIYLYQIRENPEQFSMLMEQLPKEELVDILSLTFKNSINKSSSALASSPNSAKQ